MGRTLNQIIAALPRKRQAKIDAEYRAQLQKMVEEADADKAKRIAALEKELNNQQTAKYSLRERKPPIQRFSLYGNLI